MCGLFQGNGFPEFLFSVNMHSDDLYVIVVSAQVHQLCHVSGG